MAEYIYGLTDPRTDEIVYVGATNSPDHRLAAHMVDKHNPRVRALADELRQCGLSLGMKILESVCKRYRNQREREWIADMLEEGKDLYNIGLVYSRGRRRTVEEIRSGPGPTGRLDTIVTVEQREFIDKMMDENGMTRGEVLRDIIDYYINSQGESK